MFSNKFWAKYQNNVYSQHGEDGCINELFKRLNICDGGWACEFGAADGKWLSNTFNLVENKNFNCVMIESNQNAYKNLLKTKERFPNIIPVNKIVGFNDSEDNLDNILKKTNIPKDFDLLSIDIDSYDYQVWRDFNKYKPKLVIIEIHSGIDPYNEEWIHTENKYKMTGFRPMFNLGLKKGYKFLFHNGNMWFIREDLYEKVNIKYNHEIENFRPYVLDDKGKSLLNRIII